MTSQPDSAVLVVDDDAASRTVLRLGCESVGLAVVEAGSGVVALEMAITRPFALILLDLGLPDITGLEVCRRLRDDGVVTPIIVVSAYCGQAQVELGLAAGADEYVEKPYRLGRLLVRIQAYAPLRDSGVQLSGQPVERIPGAPAGDARPADRRSRRARSHELRP